MEEWRNIKGYEGDYQVSSYGRIKSLKWGNEKNLKNQKHYKGYEFVTLLKNGKSHKYKVHRLVAQAFIPNPNNYPQVNHKDENKANNKVENLEWCTNKYNANYGTKNKRTAMKNSKKVICITTGDIFNSMKEAREYFNIKGPSCIASCCQGERKSAGKHPITGEKLVWRYYES